VVALTEDAIDAAAETGGDGMRPRHDLQPNERRPGRKADRCSGWAVVHRSGKPHGSFRGANPTRVAEHETSLGTENFRFVSFLLQKEQAHSTRCRSREAWNCEVEAKR
jgi:hypothetical protein